MSENKLVKAKGFIVQILYPKNPAEHIMGTFAIVKFHVTKVLQGNIDEGEIITLKGTMPRLEYSKSKDPLKNDFTIYIASAKEVFDRTYGRQYEVMNMRMDYPLESPEEQRAFLEKILTPTQVENLFAITDNPIKWLEAGDKESLVQVKGVSEKTATRLIEKYNSSLDNAGAYVSLSDYGLTLNAINKLVKIYRSADIAIERIKENPYILIREVRGYGWKKADEIAQRQGITSDSEVRVKAYTEYYLQEQCEANGHSWLDINVLLTAVQAECQPITDQKLVEYVHNMLTEDVENHYFDVEVGGDEEDESDKGLRVITDKGPLLYFDAETNRAGLRRYHDVEETIANNLYRIQTAENHTFFDKNLCSKIIKTVEQEQGFDYSDEQINAIWNILNNQVSILTGKGGTGKTYTVNAVVKILKAYNQEPQMCALSGRASSKLSEVTHIHGSTIHKLLSYNPKLGRFMYDENNQLPGDMFILDEASMVGGELFASLVKAIPSGAKFLMVGDIAQLEAIGMGNVLKDCMASGVISSNILTKIHRQAQQSGIITESLRVSQGQTAFSSDAILDGDYRGELKDLKFVTYSDYNLSQIKILNEFKELYLTRHVPAKDIQVIVPMRSRGNISCRCLNEEIQKIVNGGDTFHQKQVEYNDNGIKWTVTYKENDRIIVTKNDYHAITPDGKEIAIFNGNIGYIKRINIDHMIIDLLSQGEVILYEKQYKDIAMAYCITCHKMQGDSAPYVIFGFDTSCYALYSRELIYTAISRARKFCSVVVQNKAFFSAVKISRVKLKQTWLKDKLQKLFIGSTPEEEE